MRERFAAKHRFLFGRICTINGNPLFTSQNRKYGESARLSREYSRASSDQKSQLSNRFGFDDKISRLHAYASLRFFDRRSKRRRLETEKATEGLIYSLHTLRWLSQKARQINIYSSSKVIIFPQRFTSTVSHHPLMNKISLLPNLPCYLPSFNRKHPFLCTFSPLDHLDPIPISKLVLEINRPRRSIRDDSTMHNSQDDARKKSMYVHPYPRYPRELDC